jgi:hypothetical protein
MRIRPTRRGRAAGNLAVLGVLVASIAAPVTDARAARRSPSAARLARTLNGADVARLYFVRQLEGEVLYEKGKAKGALPGEMRAKITVEPGVLKGSCTIYTSGGSISGEGHATARGAGQYQSFRGTLLITKGTGRYKDIHGRAGLYGTFDTRTFAVVVQTTGTLSY